MSELADIGHGILLLDDGNVEVLDQGSSLKVLYALDLKVTQSLYVHDQAMIFKLFCGISTRVNLPKASTPTFDGDNMNWSSFCEQFEVFVHKKQTLRVEKAFAYLRDELKDGSVRKVIQSSSQINGNYAKAIKCL